MENAICIDYGGHSIKVGLATHTPGEDDPPVVAPAAVTRAADADGGPAGPPAPVVLNGAIVDADGLEAILHYALYGVLGLGAGCEGAAVVAEPLLAPRADREALAQRLFEGFGVSGLYVQDAASLSLAAFGRTQGVAVDLGHGGASIGAVLDGACLAPSARRLPALGGAALTGALRAAMAVRGAALSADQAEALKERCLAAHDSLAAADAAAAAGREGEATTSYTLPDGTVLEVGGEGREVVETLFRPPQAGGGGLPGIATAALDAVVDAVDSGARRLLLANVLLCGGGSRVPGLQARMLRELRTQVAPTNDPALATAPEYLPGGGHAARYAAWIGASIMAKVMTAQPHPGGHFTTKADYEERGPSAVHRKCGG